MSLDREPSWRDPQGHRVGAVGESNWKSSRQRLAGVLSIFPTLWNPWKRAAAFQSCSQRSLMASLIED